MTPDEQLEDLRRYAEKLAAEENRDRVCCENCAWFSAGPKDDSEVGSCLRYPPRFEDDSLLDEEKAASNYLWTACPRVIRKWVCGEFLHKRTGFTPYGSLERQSSAAMRSRLAQLEDEIQALKLRGDA